MPLNIVDGVFSRIINFCIWPPGGFECKKKSKKTKKIKITSALFIIYLHNELHNEIYLGAEFYGFLFSHLATRGLRIVKKWKKQITIKITSSLFVIDLHNELQTCRRS